MTMTRLGDSNSILNQKKYLEGYAEQKGYTNCQHYTDDGWSGGNFERPAWKQLIADIEAGKVAHVLVKDMSRIGRDYLQTGFYTEVMFRQHGVQFVAIANSVDSDDQKEHRVDSCNKCLEYPCKETSDYQAKYVNKCNQI